MANKKIWNREIDLTELCFKIIKRISPVCEKCFADIKRLFIRFLPLAVLFVETWTLFSIQTESAVNVLYNMILYGLLLAVFMILPLNWYIIYALNGMLLFAVDYLTRFLISVRSRPFHYMDFFSVKEALRVADNYKPLYNRDIGVTALYTVLIIAVCCTVYRAAGRNSDLRRLKKALTGVGTFAFCIAGLWLLPAEPPALGWYEADYVRTNGPVYAVYCEYRNSSQKMPEGYSYEAVSWTLNRYRNKEEDKPSAGETPDDIYVIMNESFTDYSLVGETVFTEDPLKNLHAMKENCFTGKCAVSVYGGNTANSEYEFLTGESLAFAPSQAVPYMLYSFRNHSSIVSDITVNGYTPKALHPYIGAEWKRNSIYYQLGFTDFVSGEKLTDSYTGGGDDIFGMNGQDFGKELEYIRGFVSDAECYNKMTAIADSDRNFIFTVTIQNHGGFDKMDPADERITKYTKSRLVNEYLYSLNNSDEAFEELTERLKDSDRKTVVLMFGDHLPNVNKMAVYDEMPDMECGADNYIVPYILWANYDIEWDAPEFTSINYLSAILKKNCNLPLTRFDNFRLKVIEKYPVVTAYFVIDDKGQFLDVDKAIHIGMLHDYAMIQYSRFNNHY